MTKDEQIAKLAAVIADLQRKLEVSERVKELQGENFRELHGQFVSLEQERDAMIRELESRRKFMAEAPKVLHRALVRAGVRRETRVKVEALAAHAMVAK